MIDLSNSSCVNLFSFCIRGITLFFALAVGSCWLAELLCAKIETYCNVIAELEKQLEHDGFWLNAAKPDVPNTLSKDPEFAFSTKIKNLLKLSKLAFKTDSTRVITFRMDWIYGAIKVPGATGGWHTLSHHGGKQNLLEPLSRIEMDIIKHLNEFLSDLDNSPFEATITNNFAVPLITRSK